MNFLRTMSLQRIADLMKVKLQGEPLRTQSNLDIEGGRNITLSQVETRDLTTITITAGGENGTLGYWGSFFDTTDQSIASTTTAYEIGLNGTDPDSDGVSIVGGNQITPVAEGNYNISVSLQLTNTDASAHDAVIWFRKNGTDISDSASKVTVPSTHGGKLGHLIFYVDLALHLNTGDYVQLMWHGESTALKLETLPAGTTPVYPQIPSAIVSVVQV